MTEHDWSQLFVESLAQHRLEFLPYVPDGVLAPVLDKAGERPELTLVPLTREEEGVGVATGVVLAGRRAALLMQTSGMGNCLNAIGSLAVAQRIPLLMVVTERGGLGEKVSTQVPFGSALQRVLQAMAVPCFPVGEAGQIPVIVEGAVDLAYVSRVPTVVLLTARLLAGGAS